MDAEIQFFMTTKDEAEFLLYAEIQVDEIECLDEIKEFKVGDCILSFTPSQLIDSTLFIGRLEIRLGLSESKHQERTKTVFRKLRNWLKKNYYSRLAYINKRGKLTPSRVHWLGPDAKNWKIKNPQEHLLKLSTTSKTFFDLGF